ncbi:unnamed protein product [Calypogeia fissa]
MSFPASSIHFRGFGLGLGYKAPLLKGCRQDIVTPRGSPPVYKRQGAFSTSISSVCWSRARRRSEGDRQAFRLDGMVLSNGGGGGKCSSSRQMRASAVANSSDSAAVQPLPVMVIGVTGKMGLATAQAVVAAGRTLVPITFVAEPAPERVDVMGVNVRLRDQSERDAVLDEVLSIHPNVVIVDFTVPQAVNDNAEFYCRRGVPFVMGTTGGDRVKLMNDVLNSGNYAVIAPQMGKQVVAFQAAMQIMSEQFPGAFSGYKLQVTESHQSSKLDTSGTAKAVVASFVKLGLDFDVHEIEKVRDREQQIERMKVPEEYLPGHAFHTYRVVSPDGTVAFEFQHNVCGRSIYAEGTVDAVLFLAKKVELKTEKKVYDMIDVLREGNMR